jgi:putative ABC transport system ATP-binding protein
VSIGGEDITRMGDAKLAKLRRRRLGFVFQSFNLIDSLTARDNIRLPLELDGRAPDRQHMEDLAQRLGIADRLDHFPYQLSGGQQQRIAVIRALASDPDVIFADEPTAALDPIAGRQLIDLMLQIAHDDGHAVVAISHDPAVAASGDRVFRMECGQLKAQPGPADIPHAAQPTIPSPPALRVDVRP